jgi:hypothetical protein
MSASLRLRPNYWRCSEWREVPLADIWQCRKKFPYSITSSAIASTPGGLGEFLFQLGVRFANAVNVSSGLRSRRTKTAGMGLVLRPFARQGHLVGTVDRPMLVAPS